MILYPTYYLLFDCLLFTIEETINYQLSIPPLPFSDRFPSVLRQSVRLSFTWANGAVYEGSWKNNKRDGRGVYKWSNGDVYDGDWKDNRPNGQGTLKTVAGMQYKGGFVDGLEDGQGVQIDKDGNRFDGFFKQGKKNGPFVETDKDGKVIKKGTYKFGRLQ